MFKLMSIIFLAFFVLEAAAQIKKNGQCPEVVPLSSFNVTAFLGRWYKVVRYPNSTPILNNTRCSYGDFSLVGENIVYDGFGIDLTSGDEISMKVEAVPYGDGAFGVGDVDKPNYFIKVINYSKYVVLYTCTNVNKFEYTIAAWAETRGRRISKKDVPIIKKAFDDLNIKSSQIKLYNQKNCPKN